jgi:hypothetical protein
MRGEEEGGKMKDEKQRREDGEENQKIEKRPPEVCSSQDFENERIFPICFDWLISRVYIDVWGKKPSCCGWLKACKIRGRG